MTPDTPLFDMQALQMRRDRAKHAFSRADFLHRAAAAEIKERLAEVNRPLTDAAIIGWQAPLWAQILDRTSPPALIPEADVLALASASCDLVIHALGLHWANDPVGQLVQARHALRPDGLMIAALIGGRSLHQLRAALAEAEAGITGGLSPRVSPMGDLRDLGGLLQRAGLALPVADVQVLNATYESTLHLMHDLRAMAETNVLSARRRVPLRRDVLMRAAEIYAREWCLPDGRVGATFEIVYLTGWAPADSQPRPLRPGSAAARLADALNTTEIATGEAALPATQKGNTTP